MNSKAVDSFLIKSQWAILTTLAWRFAIETPDSMQLPRVAAWFHETSFWAMVGTSTAAFYLPAILQATGLSDWIADKMEARRETADPLRK